MNKKNINCFASFKSFCVAVDDPNNFIRALVYAGHKKEPKPEAKHTF
jgi:hypothetical protein